MADNTEFLALARKRFDEAESDERELREAAKTDLEFIAGEQWDEGVKQARIKAQRPVLTFNRMHTFVQQVSNEARQNKPQIKYVPAEEGDKDTAEIYEGIARNVQYGSDAQVAYETAVEYAAGGGFGHYQMLSDYCDNESWDQEVKIKPIYDPFSVYGILIPAIFGYKPRFAFKVENMPKADYIAKYGETAAATDWESAQRDAGSWMTTETIRIAEYYTVEEVSRTIEGPNGRKRTVWDTKVKVCTINGTEILPDTETEWVGSQIPIWAVLGKQMIVDGKPVLLSVVRFQRDPQRLINFYKTRIAETLGTAPIQPYMVPKDADKDFEQEWSNLNTTMRPSVHYNAYDENGRQIPPPTRQVFEPPIAALSNAAAEEIDDTKATAGIYDASLGARSNESSGIALQRRQQQSSMTNMHFMDNLERSLKQSGQELALVIPKIYDTERIVRILGADESAKLVKINGDGPKIGGEGVAKYDVIVTMGRSFSTKRMESFDMMSQVMQASPQQFPMWADIFFKNSDLAGADQLSERFKKMLPPQLQEQPEGEVQIPPQVQAQMAQLTQQHEQLTAALNQAQQAIETKQVEVQSRERIEMAKIDFERWKFQMEKETQLTIAAENAKVQDLQERIARQEDMWKHFHDQAHELGMESQRHVHGLQSAEQANDFQQAAQAQEVGNGQVEGQQNA